MSRISAQSASVGRPAFDVAVPPSGYRWWYADGISEDGDHAIVVIAFVGSVFSPYYFRARSRGPADPTDFCAINIGLYRRRGDLWAMTERGRGAVDRSPDRFRVGPSRLEWHDDRLDIHIRERCTPFAQRLQGRLSIYPEVINERAFLLDAGGRHSWHPYAPTARIAVDLQRPGLRWSGHGYFDSNAGERALEDDFLRWNWSRGRRGDNAVITYAVTEVSGQERALALRFGPDGTPSELLVPGAEQLPRTGWRVDREVRSEPGASVLRTLEDTPFYTRSLVRAGNAGVVMHESLALDRFRSGWVQFLLPFRMPRRRGPVAA